MNLRQLVLCIGLAVLAPALTASDVKIIFHDVSPSLPQLTESWGYTSPSDDTFVVVSYANGVQLIPNTSRVLKKDTRVMWVKTQDDAAVNEYTATLPPTARPMVHVEGNYTTGGSGGPPPIYDTLGADIDLDMDTNNDGPTNLYVQDNNELQEDVAESGEPGALVDFFGKGAPAVIRKLSVNSLKVNDVYLERPTDEQGRPLIDCVDGVGISLFGSATATRSINLYDRVIDEDFHFQVIALIGECKCQLIVHRTGTNEQGKRIE